MNDNIIRWALGLLTTSVVALCTWVMNTNSELAVLKDNIIPRGAIRMSVVENEIANSKVANSELRLAVTKLDRSVQHLTIAIAKMEAKNAN